MATKNKSTTNKRKSVPKKTTGPKKTTQAKIKPTPRKKTDGDQYFPGYPKYGAENDITTKAKRVDENLDDEVLTQVKHNHEPKSSKAAPDEKASKDETKSKSKFDVTDEDIEALGPKDLSLDMGDDEQLKHRNRPVDFSGEDLDVPGTELDDEQEERGSEDEENNIYSLGGDEKNNLEEGQEHEGSL